MSLDHNSGITNNQRRVSNSDRNQSTRYNMLDNGQSDDLKRYEAMNRRNLIAVLSFVGFIVVIFLIILLVSLL